MATKKTGPADSGSTGDTGGAQPPPPDVDQSSLEGAELPEGDQAKGGGGKKFIEFDAAEAIYNQLVMTRKTLDELVDEAKEAKVRKQLDQLPVNVSDVMRGFQGAVSRANRAVLSGEEDGEDIERMVIRNLEISIDAPIINEAHAEDPMIMLPNEDSGNIDRAKVTLKFNVVSVPKTQRQ